MTKARKYVLLNHFEGEPKRIDFKIVEYDLPELKIGEILVKVEYFSVDPYQRAYNIRFNVPYDQFGYNVGIIEESKNPNFPVGTRVVSHTGWCDYYIENLSREVISDTNAQWNHIYKLPDLKGLSISQGIYGVGMIGATAYFGFLEICQPKPGETVVVTGAAGAVGSLVGQIAKIKGCKVIGFAGSDEKVKWLEKDLGFDKAFNYKTVDIANVLKEAAPEGVDCYFDNVGGEISSMICTQMKKRGRVSVCGSISAYNQSPNEFPKATILQPSILFNELKIEGFLITRWIEQWNEAFVELVDWIRSGQLVVREHVTEGFDNASDAFIDMLRGGNLGKALVKL